MSITDIDIHALVVNITEKKKRQYVISHLNKTQLPKQ